MTDREKIKHFREEKGISAEKLADMIGVAKTTVIRYENGSTKTIPHDRVLEIAKVLGVPVQLLEDDYGYIQTVGNQALCLDNEEEMSTENRIQLLNELDESMKHEMMKKIKPVLSVNGLEELIKIYCELSTDNRSKLLELSHLYLNAQNNTQ